MTASVPVRASRNLKGQGSGVTAPAQVIVQVRREERRGRCYNCRTRRVVYRIAVWVGWPRPSTETLTEQRCAPCWGIRE